MTTGQAAGRGSQATALFTVAVQDPRSKARIGHLRTRRGLVETPVFMPVATQASVKTVSQDELRALGATTLLANSYHLSLRPGEDLVSRAGGMHRFMAWDGAILTDSGGFQVMSLASFRKISEEGVSFRSYLDGSARMFTPESVIGIQSALDSDMWTCLDVCPPYGSSASDVETALRQTQRWSLRAKAAYDQAILTRNPAPGTMSPVLFGIAQGAFNPALRREAVEFLLEHGFEALAFGGFSVGEEKSLTWENVDRTTDAAPAHLPRYLMGMGDAPDLWDAAAAGIDMLDCVWPTRVARHGQAMTLDGPIQIRNAAFREDRDPVDASCDCPACRSYSRSYICHLFRASEALGARLLSLHNIRFLIRLTGMIKESIRSGNFLEARKAFLDRYQKDR